LDIGGGGEGIIGRLYQSQVTAIDIRQDELDEAPDGFEKLVMDAAHLTFEDGSFDHVTAFFALMFMDDCTQNHAIAQAARVLKENGQLHIWDCDIESAYPDPFCVDVSVQLPEKCIETTYGIGKLDAQSSKSILRHCKQAGFVPVCEVQYDGGFYLCLKKGQST